MAILARPTSISVSVPLLIEVEHLVAIDQIFDEYIERLREDREQHISELIQKEIADTGADEKVVRERKQPYYARFYGREERSVEMYLKGGTTIRSDRFADVLKQPHVGNEIATGFRAELKIGRVKSSVHLRSGWTDWLAIGVTPDNISAGQQLFGSLENWAADVAAPPWQRLWRKLKPAFGFVLYLWLILGLLLVAVPPTRSAKELYGSEVENIIKNGVTDSNQHRALQLILAIVSDYSVTNATTGQRWTIFGYVLTGALILAALYMSPTVVIGIWGGKQRLRLWKAWIRTLWVTIPALIITTVLWPKLLRWFGIN